MQDLSPQPRMEPAPPAVEPLDHQGCPKDLEYYINLVDKAGFGKTDSSFFFVVVFFMK